MTVKQTIYEIIKAIFMFIGAIGKAVEITVGLVAAFVSFVSAIIGLILAAIPLTICGGLFLLILSLF